MTRISNKQTYVQYLVLYAGVGAFVCFFICWIRAASYWPETVFFVIFILFLLGRRFVDSVAYENGRLEITSYRFGFRRTQVFDTATVHIGLIGEEDPDYVGGVFPVRPPGIKSVLRISEGPHTLVKISSNDGFRKEDLVQLEQAINDVRN